MMKMDLGTGSGSKIFQLNDQVIELLVKFLHHDSDNHVYHMRSIHGEIGDSLKDSDIFFKAIYDHMQDLIMELTK